MKSLFITLLFATATVFAQTRTNDLVSPEVQTDRRVTFRIRAPKASVNVSVPAIVEFGMARN